MSPSTFAKIVVTALLPLTTCAATTSASAIAFGEVRIGESASSAAVVSNPGSETISVWLSDSCEEVSLRSTCGEVQAGGSCSAFLTYTPTREGPMGCQLLVGSSDAPVQMIHLTGYGTRY